MAMTDHIPPGTKPTGTSNPLVDALRELIRLKDLKTDAEAINTSGDWNAYHRQVAMFNEHDAKKGEAWDAARRALIDHDRHAPETRALPTLRRFRPVVEGGHIRSMAEVGNPNGFGGWNAEYVLASDYDALARGELNGREGQ